MNTHTNHTLLLLAAITALLCSGCVMGPDAETETETERVTVQIAGEAAVQASLKGDDGCADDGQLVCGDDGLTYASRCAALSNGTEIASVGECVGNLCTANSDCGNDEYCATADDHCGARAGTCTYKPVVCVFTVDSVCGCNGETYENACVAAADGASVAGYGACL
ncbi:MAG: hypothetical protein ACI9WU_000539 [Myxococcota bacterium]|jgi:hypothetical protein